MKGCQSWLEILYEICYFWRLKINRQFFFQIFKQKPLHQFCFVCSLLLNLKSMFTISLVSLLLPFPDPQIWFRSLTTTRIWCLGFTSCFGPLKGGRKNGYNFVAILFLALKTIFTSSFWKYIAPFFAIYRHVFLQSVIHEKKVLTILMSFLLVS